MYNLFPAIIKEGCTSERTYLKALDYFWNGAVEKLRFFPESNYFDAEVRGGEIYDVSTVFDVEGDLLEAYCDCPAHENYAGHCKHIAAVLISIYENMDEVQRVASQGDKTVDNILKQLKEQETTAKEELKLDFTLCCNLFRRYGDFPHRSLRLRAGAGKSRMYVVRSVKRFLEALADNRPLQFGKQFSYDPKRHFIAPVDRPVIEMLLEMLEIEQLAGTSFLNTPPFYESKEIVFTGRQFVRLLDLMRGRRVSAEINKTEYSEVEIREEKAPLEFRLQDMGEDLLLSLEGENLPVPLTPGGEFFFVDGNIYRLPEEQRTSFPPFYRGFLEGGDYSIRIQGWDKEKFISTAIRHLEQAGKLEIDEELSGSLIREPMQAEIYLDAKSGAVAAEVIFRYGPLEVNPFQKPEEYSGTPGEALLVREQSKENRVLELLSEAGFRREGNEMVLEEEDKVLRFLQEGLIGLQEKADIYYSDSFKRLRIRPAPRLQVFASLNTSLDMLEVEFELHGIDTAEIKDVWSSLKERKKYHRLKDGSFLPLESREMQDFDKLAEAMEAEGSELKKGTLQRPKAGALFIEELAKNEGLENLRLSGNARDMLEKFRRYAEKPDSLPAGMRGILRPYQLIGFSWMKALARNGLGGILADDMGLGKTVQAIALILSEVEEKKKSGSTHQTLVIAPTSVVYNWEAELKRFAPTLGTLVVSGNKKEREGLLQDIKGVDVVVTSYSLLRRDADHYLAQSFDLCLLDEAQNIKNPSSAAARAARGLKTGTVFALTGTPLENSLVELWSVFQCVLPGFLPSFKKFKQKYIPARGKGSSEGKNNKTAEELAAKIRPFILRRLKEDVLDELPPKIETPVYAELNREQKNIYLSYLERLRGMAEQELGREGGEGRIKVLAGLTRLRQICCHPGLFLENYSGGSAKMELLRELLRDTLGSGHRILLFSQFTGMLRLVRTMLEEEGYSFFYLDGGVKTQERLERVNAFNNGQGQLFLISLKAGGTGLNLTGADTVIQYDLWWNPAVEEQASGRAHRLGQEKVVQVFRLLSRGTIEEKIDRLQQEKKNLIQKVIQPGETFLSALSDEEIRDILEV